MASTIKKVVISSAFATGLFLATPQLTDAALGDQTLRKGMDHPDVKDLQKALKEKGFFQHDTATGFYGSITEDAVRKFQQQHRLAVDGIAGPQTLSVLLAQMGEQAKVQVQQKTTTTQAQTQKVQAQSNVLNTNMVLRAGSKGKEVEALQIKLKEQGYYNHKVTGQFGRQTTDAVKAFQRKNKLTVDGIVGPQTLSVLLNERQPASTQTNNVTLKQPTAQQSTILRNGSKGAQVSKLQTDLKELGFYKNSITGNFGGVTEVAVRDFQRSQKLKVDGIVGPQTFAAINKALEAKKKATPKVPAQPAAPKTPAPTTQPAPSTPAPAPAPSVQPAPSTPSTTLTIGVRSDQVTLIQTQLRSLGLFHVEPTGYYGDITAQSVREFQRLNNLPVTGNADEQTIAKINEVATSRATQPAPTNNAALMTNLIADAATFVGVPYLWGGSTPAGFDCSGLVQYVFRNQGITIPRTVALQWNAGVPVAEPSIGDIVFFETISAGPSHNGIYIGNNQFIHSGSSTGVIVASLNSNYWSQRYLGAKRLH
ncbi:peptidoglycan-binding protein [Alkalihalobacterium alkalicellulosilyticum]|uniref:C40 family peptidase n=1 Tax=Alkalihalobacterium alkalicellulosilyticum TaxID=1912214 RepID=UPI0009973878|nr:peptidoglycan-binding protein [Bacillus alkalicellulosilyticus]